MLRGEAGAAGGRRRAAESCVNSEPHQEKGARQWSGLNGLGGLIRREQKRLRVSGSCVSGDLPSARSIACTPPAIILLASLQGAGKQRHFWREACAAGVRNQSEEEGSRGFMTSALRLSNN